MNTSSKNYYNEPYRLMFPLGIFFLLWGIFLWVPQIWNQDNYPVLTHRTLVLNGFMAMYVGGFLMTAVPKFSRTHVATPREALSYIFLSSTIVLLSYIVDEKYVLLLSSLQALLLFLFAFRRFKITTASPPFSFIFIFLGILLWILSGVAGQFFTEIPQISLQYDGAILAIILGIGSKLIPGILGHSEVLNSQSFLTEKKTYLKSVPPYFYALMLLYAISFLIEIQYGTWVRFFIVLIISLKFWKLHLLPPIKSALTYCIWFCAWLILSSIFLKAIWQDGFIHAGHSFFINGIVLLSILVATRVLVAHGPMKKELENSKWLHAITFFVVLAAATRVSAYLMPESYNRHLAYSSLSLGLGIIIWSYKYLRLATVFPKENS